MNTKGQVAFVAVFITAVLAVVLIANLLVPTVKTSTYGQNYAESFTKVNASANETFTLTHFPLLTFDIKTPGGLSLTNNTNYTINTDTGSLVLKTGTGNLTYSTSYVYSNNAYLTSAGDRALFAMVILAAFIGLLYFLFKSTGVI